MQFKIGELAELVNGEINGDDSLIITGVAKIEDAHEGQLTFISNPKYEKYIDDTKASAILVNKDFPATSKTVIRTENSYIAFLKILKTFTPRSSTLDKGVHSSAVIDSSSILGENSAIGALVYIGKRCRIGDNIKLYPGVVICDDVEIGNNTILYPNVTIREGVRIGNDVIIHNGAVIGSDGFGFAREGDSYQKIPQVGIVVIEDDVEIGSNCTIDRATMGETRIKKGAKLDNLIQVAHNVIIGESTVIAAQTGISGSTKIGRDVSIGGQVGFVGHIEIGDGAAIGAQSGVSKSIPSKTVVFGCPAKPMMQAKREEASLRKLPELIKKVNELNKKINALMGDEKC